MVSRLLPPAFKLITPQPQAYYPEPITPWPQAHYLLGRKPITPWLQAYYPMVSRLLPPAFKPITPQPQAYYPEPITPLSQAYYTLGRKPITPWLQDITPWFHAYYPLRSSLLPLLQHLSQVRRIRIFECRRGQWQRAHGVEQKPLGAARGACVRFIGKKVYSLKLARGGRVYSFV